MKKMKEYLSLLFIIPYLFSQILAQRTCANDSACSDCQFFLVATPLGLFGYYYCAQCSINHTINQSTGVCQCNYGYYKSSPSQCTQCPQVCTSCTSATVCTTCNSSYNRILANGQCDCVADFESKNDNPTCTKKPNVLMIALSSVGSVLLCGVMTFIFYRCCIPRSRNQHKIHDVNGNHTNRNRQSVQIYIEGDSTYMQNSSTPASFWNAKQYDFKPDEVCSICLDSRPLFMTDCGHYFHAKCIYSWLENRPHCPNCNKETNTKSLKRWCSKCNKILLPIIMNISMKRSGKNKKQLVKGTPLQDQLCDQCESSTHQVDPYSKQMFN